MNDVERQVAVSLTDSCLYAFRPTCRVRASPGDITNARGTEMFLALWVRLWGRLGTPLFNIHLAPTTVSS
jgi:hypothetical protein